ncbi:MAG TPA: alcohol dehydrogenase catalytic domain-containing protein, partial [Vicinamibacteria bacterium]|nr:alcohol dehydrogenase catalytic domain-containing protein [Vicinamibacteria bacterium]
MKAAVCRGAGDLRVEEVPVPETGPGEILVKVDACGICGTDIKKIQRGLLPGPRIFGHEIAGTVARAGAGTRWREGDRVVVHHHIPCGRCFYCGEGVYAQCEHYKKNGTTAGFEPSGGGFAEYVRALDWIAERGTIAIPDGVTPEEAAFVEPVNTCLKAVQKTRIAPGQTVLVVGQGPIGLILTQLCRREGAEVVATDTLPDRLEKSRALGASVAFDAGAVDVVREVRSLTGGRGADRAIVAAVGPAPFGQAVDATRPGGRIMLFAATSPGEVAEVDLGA